MADKKSILALIPQELHDQLFIEVAQALKDKTQNPSPAEVSADIKSWAVKEELKNIKS